MIWLFLFASFALSVYLSSKLALPTCSLSVQDIPNDRSLHARPIPRGGGIAILTSLFIFGGLAFLFVGHGTVATFWPPAGCLLLGTISCLDDRKGLAASYRLMIHFAASGILLLSGIAATRIEFAGFGLELTPIVSILFNMLFIVWTINLYNFMDGMDRLAAGMAVCGFAFLAFLGWAKEE